MCGTATLGLIGACLEYSLDEDFWKGASRNGGSLSVSLPGTISGSWSSMDSVAMAVFNQPMIKSLLTSIAATATPTSSSCF